MTTTRKLDYDIVNKTVGYTDLSDFELFADRRHIRATQVESILVALRSGKHFDAVMVVNKLNGKYRIIDGNHRFEAMKTYLSENPDVNIELKLAVYIKLTPEEERVIYTKWALGIKETIDDLLNLMKDEIPLYGILRSMSVPISTFTTPTSDTIGFKLILQMLYGTLNTEKVFSPRTVGRSEIIGVAKEYNQNDAKLVVVFLRVFRGAFGSYRENKFLRSVFCVPLFNIFYMNTQFGEQELTQRFSNCVSDTAILSRLREHSRDAKMFIRDRIMHVANRGKRKKLQSVGVKVGKK